MCGVLQHYEIMQKIKTVKFIGKLYLYEELNLSDANNIGKEGYCHICGKQLMGEQKVVCGIKCLSIKNTKRVEARFCAVCGNPFYKKVKKIRTCSRKCGYELIKLTWKNASRVS